MSSPPLSLRVEPKPLNRRINPHHICGPKNVHHLPQTPRVLRQARTQVPSQGYFNIPPRRPPGAISTSYISPTHRLPNQTFEVKRLLERLQRYISTIRDLSAGLLHNTVGRPPLPVEPQVDLAALPISPDVLPPINHTSHRQEQTLSSDNVEKEMEECCVRLAEYRRFPPCSGTIPLLDQLGFMHLHKPPHLQPSLMRR